jgi:hypothetical protein
MVFDVGGVRLGDRVRLDRDTATQAFESATERGTLQQVDLVSKLIGAEGVAFGFNEHHFDIPDQHGRQATVIRTRVRWEGEGAEGLNELEAQGQMCWTDGDLEVVQPGVFGGVR